MTPPPSPGGGTASPNGGHNLPTMYANDATRNATGPTEEEILTTRLECLWTGVSRIEDFEGLLFVRESASIHVEADGERKGGNYLVTEDAAFDGLVRWAKAKVACYTGRTDPETEVGL